MTAFRAVVSLSVVVCALVSVSACRERTRVQVPGPTTARPDPATPLLSGPVTDPKPSGAATAVRHDAGAAPSAVAPSPASSAPGEPPGVAFVKGGAKLPVGVCRRLALAVTKGKLTVETTDPAAAGAPKTTELAKGDVLVATHAPMLTLRGEGDAVAAHMPTHGCAMDDHPPVQQSVVRGNVARELTWARGAMHARLDVGPSVSPELYVGRLEGTAPVAEHTHPTAYEVLAAVEGAGTFSLEGREQRLVAPQIVVVPPNAKHAWKPDPGSRLVAVQMYSPPGPEQRFVALDAAEREAGAADAGRR